MKKSYIILRSLHYLPFLFLICSAERKKGYTPCILARGGHVKRILEGDVEIDMEVRSFTDKKLHLSTDDRMVFHFHKTSLTEIDMISDFCGVPDEVALYCDSFTNQLKNVGEVKSGLKSRGKTISMVYFLNYFPEEYEESISKENIEVISSFEVAQAIEQFSSCEQIKKRTMQFFSSQAQTEYSMVLARPWGSKTWQSGLYYDTYLNGSIGEVLNLVYCHSCQEKFKNAPVFFRPDIRDDRDINSIFEKFSKGLHALNSDDVFPSSYGIEFVAQFFKDTGKKIQIFTLDGGACVPLLSWPNLTVVIGVPEHLIPEMASKTSVQEMLRSKCETIIESVYSIINEQIEPSIQITQLDATSCVVHHL